MGKSYCRFGLDSLSITFNPIAIRSLQSVPCLPSGTSGKGGSRIFSSSASVNFNPVSQWIVTFSSSLRFSPWNSKGSFGFLMTTFTGKMLLEYVKINDT